MRQAGDGDGAGFLGLLVGADGLHPVALGNECGPLGLDALHCLADQLGVEPGFQRVSGRLDAGTFQLGDLAVQNRQLIGLARCRLTS